MQIRLQDFEKKRARCKRVSDGETFSGWIARAENDSIEIGLVLRSPLKSGDEVLVEAFADKIRAVFQARAAQARKGERDRELIVKFEVVGGIRYLDINQEGRIQVEGITVGLKLGDAPYIGQANDLSPHGVGAFLPIGLPINMVYVLEIKTAQGDTFSFDAEVRYCRKDENRYHVGFQIAQLPRIEQARWNVLIEDQIVRFAA